MTKISIEKTHIFLEKYCCWILGAILISLLFCNAFIYYKYIYLATTAEITLTIEKTVVNEEMLNEVLREIENREETLIRVQTSKYADPFN
ncbi:hypothetical protein KKG85_00810 [Patescibacteria group bacterium]|nr:hypothetical protein [Patescibacteria group bacterium]MBU2579726.1 hypothetical protein [Patescibacteria group bacterium]